MRSHKNLPLSLFGPAPSEVIENISGPQQVKLALKYLTESGPEMKNVTFRSEKWEDCSFLWEEAERKKTSSASLYEAFSLTCDIVRKECARKMGRPGCMPFSPSGMSTSCGEGHLWAERRGVTAACMSLASCRWRHVSNLLKWELNRVSCSLWWPVSRTPVNKMNVSSLRYAIYQNHKWTCCSSSWRSAIPEEKQLLT